MERVAGLDDAVPEGLHDPGVLLDEEPDLDYLLVDDWLFAKSATPRGGREL